jgi:phytoene/squalene synthetase
MSRKKKNRWAKVWISQTELGQEFGLSAVAVGKHLSALGLKDGSDASATALAKGFAVAAPLRNGIKNYRWNRERCYAALSEAGLQRLDHQAVREAKLDAEARSIVREIERLFDEGEDKMATLYWDTLDSAMAKRVNRIWEARYSAKKTSGEHDDAP